MEPRRPFSERMGLVPNVVQTDGMDAALRNSIWNFVSGLLELPRDQTRTGDRDRIQHSVELITQVIIRVPVQRIDHGYPVGWLLEQFEQLPWHRVYDALEYVVGHAVFITNGRMKEADVRTLANKVLEREHSGFRFIGDELSRVMHPAEAAEVEHARTNATASGLDGVRQQIDQALALFGKRPVADHRNAIKEAVSAVEGAVKLVEGVRGGGLKEALSALAKRVEIHPALRAALDKLYAFASDEDGIRHAIVDEPNVGEEDARFMIVACSAVVNWIIAKAERAGALKKNTV